MNKPDEDFFEIDIYQLDQEWVKQPKNYYYYASEMVIARKNWEECKASKDLVEAELSKSIRSTPSEYGIEKVTEGSITTAIISDEKYQDEITSVINAKNKVDTIQAILDALEHKKKALENIVQLQLANYFAQPRIKGEDGEIMKQRKIDRAFGEKKRSD